MRRKGLPFRAMAAGAILALCLAWGCRRQAPSSGSAQMASTPSGATVFIDNQFAGITPCVARDLSPGIHSLKLERKGCRRYCGLLTVGASPAILDVALETDRSSEVRIASIPADAAIYVNGQYRGRTPATLAGLAAGSYEIRLQEDNCDAWLRTVLLRTGEKLALNADMESPAEKFLRGAIAQKPTEVAYYVELARHYISRKKYDLAVAVYKTALDRRDKSMESRLYTEIGWAYGGQFKSAESEADVETLRSKIVGIFAQTGNALTFYTSAHRGLSQGKRATSPDAEKARLDRIQQLELHLAGRPDEVKARLELGKLYLDRMDTKHAQEHFKLVAQVTEKNWMTEAETRQEAAQRAKGLVKLDGKWVTPKEVERLALARLAPAEKARRVALEQAASRQKAEELAREKVGQLAREKANREAEALAKKQQAEKAKREAEELARKQAGDKAAGLANAPKAFRQNESEWLVDSLQSGDNWKPESWADPAAVTVVPAGSGKALNIAYSGGKCAKACISRQILEPVDISSRGKLVVDVANNSKTLAMLSVLITADQDYESLPQFVGPGRQQRLVFPIRGRSFKCKQDNWNKYAFAIAQPKNTTRLGILVNSPAELVVKNMKLTK